VSLKQAALDSMVPGILGDCGGTATCGTCHVYVDAEYVNRLAAPSDDEEMTLSGVLAPVAANSRLSCQIPVSDSIDGIVLRLPEVQ
jgi:2Fe-2S ferredoxin